MIQNHLPLRKAYAPGFRDPVEAFEDAIRTGRLSATPADHRFAGRYMYMGTQDGHDLFKHVGTREYLAFAI